MWYTLFFKHIVCILIIASNILYPEPREEKYSDPTLLIRIDFMMSHPWHRINPYIVFVCNYLNELLWTGKSLVWALPI